MYELVQVGEKTYYIECPAKMGLYRINESEVCLIDSGNDKDSGKKSAESDRGAGLETVHDHQYALSCGSHRRKPVAAAEDGLQDLRCRQRPRLYQKTAAGTGISLRRLSSKGTAE